MQHTSRTYDLEQRTANFAFGVRSYVRSFPHGMYFREDIVQLIRSSGSVAANYVEANCALGKKDFIMRLRICLKEVREARLWLRLLNAESNDPHHVEQWRALIDEAEQLVRIFSVAIRTSLKKLEQSKRSSS